MGGSVALVATAAGKHPASQSSKEPHLLWAGEQSADYYGMRFRWRGAACRTRATKPIPLFRSLNTFNCSFKFIVAFHHSPSNGLPREIALDPCAAGGTHGAALVIGKR